MRKPLKAVIFDMDGVLINSEPLWRRAMIKGFTESGIPFTEDDCRKTTGKRIGEVVTYWLETHRTWHLSAATLERNIVDHLLELIDLEGEPIDGIPRLLGLCENKGLKTGLATSSSNELMQTVLKKLNLESYFLNTTSAEFLKYGKPHPEVFLDCAAKLNTAPQECVVIEDSLNGVIAGKAAQMTVIAVPDEEHKFIKGLEAADFCCANMFSAYDVLSSLL